jgi:hypothetical protein
MKPMKIISGGQTGADRAALDFALEAGIDCGGWCPKGRVAEDGTIPAEYPLQETDSPDSARRTRRNVKDSDATVIFDPPAGRPSPGTALTARVCGELGKPHVVLRSFPDVEADSAQLVDFLAKHAVRILNVAGHREGGTPGMYVHVRAVLVRSFAARRSG